MLLIKQQQRIHFISRFRKTNKPFLNHGTIGLSKSDGSHRKPKDVTRKILCFFTRVT